MKKKIIFSILIMFLLSCSNKNVIGQNINILKSYNRILNVFESGRLILSLTNDYSYSIKRDGNGSIVGYRISYQIDSTNKTLSLFGYNFSVMELEEKVK